MAFLRLRVKKEETPLLLYPVDRAIPNGTDQQIANSSAYQILVSPFYLKMTEDPSSKTKRFLRF
jgi:hypothetical protein